VIESTRLLEIIGHEAMGKLCREYGGCTIYVPIQPPAPERDSTIRSLFSESLHGGTSTMSSYRLCAEEFGLSVRRVQEIIAK
jgi:DNA invertase Pin-like site-specific DNA recombinase